MECHEICTQVLCREKAKNLLSKIFLPTPKILVGKTSNLHQIFEDLHQSEAHFKVAQHINKQIKDISSTINVLKTVPNLEPSPHRVSLQARKKIDKL